MEKKDQKAVPLVDNLDALNEKLRQVREAQRAFATYTQEQVDNIFYAAAMAANRQRIPLAKMAVAETGMGVVEDKVIKNHYAAEYIYNQYKNTKTCGVLESDPAFGVQKIAEPIGVVAAVIPTTNPTSTAIFKALLSLKTRNGIVISPHPRAKKCTIEAARVVLEAAVAAGAPENIIAWIDVPSLELTNAVMKEADIILATGGPGMVKAAYSSGKPALGVGAGNLSQMGHIGLSLGIDQRTGDKIFLHIHYNIKDDLFVFHNGLLLFCIGVIHSIAQPGQTVKSRPYAANCSAKACIINISSTSDMYGTPKLTTYCMAKWGRPRPDQDPGPGAERHRHRRQHCLPHQGQDPAAPQGMAGSFAILYKICIQKLAIPRKEVLQYIYVTRWRTEGV